MNRRNKGQSKKKSRGENQSETPKIDKDAFETHPILCQFDGGLKTSENEIELYRSNHILAHIIRFICLKKPGDALSIIFRLCSDNKISLSERSKVIAEANKDAKILFWSSEWQRIQGLKGGKKGGLANTVAQFEGFFFLYPSFFFFKKRKTFLILFHKIKKFMAEDH